MFQEAVETSLRYASVAHSGVVEISFTLDRWESSRVFGALLLGERSDLDPARHWPFRVSFDVPGFNVLFVFEVPDAKVCDLNV